jgi:putative transcriptional regulator
MHLHFDRERGATMAVSYKKLWHILLDRDMKKKDLEEKAGLSHYTMSKMSRDENVTTEVLGKICNALDCKVEDFMEFIPDDKE